jgi:hypothetical protein
MPLSKVIENIQRGTWELVEDNRKHRADLKAKTTEYVESADLCECLGIINELIERVSTLTGEAGSLEDQACKIINELANGDMECWGGD